MRGCEMAKHVCSRNRGDFQKTKPTWGVGFGQKSNRSKDGSFIHGLFSFSYFVKDPLIQMTLVLWFIL